MGDVVMNSVIKSFLQDHEVRFELDSSEEKQFEHLINYITMRDYSARTFDPADASLGEGEVGLDGVGIFVNGILVSNLNEIESFFADEKGNKNTDISVSVIFTQSSISENFDSKKVSFLFSMVKDFVEFGKINNTSERYVEIQSIYKYILEHPTHLSKNPDCHINFAYTGIEPNVDIVNNLFDNLKNELMKKCIFDEIKFSLYDSRKITDACRSVRRSIQKTVPIKGYSTLPAIPNVSESFIGTIKCKDYIKLITNDDDILLTHLFEDNVRYYQGRNKVNSEIYSTISDLQQQQAFVLLNNGVTIIAKEIRRTGDNFVLENFQIVNGCQTSFVLYENRKKLSDNSYVAVKLISSTDKRIVDSIVKTTNSQTPITDESFETLRDFHKDLESVYESYDKEHRLFYERQSKQYDSMMDVNQSRVVSFPAQTAAYVAMFLGQPQSTHRYYGELLKANKPRIYQDDDIKEQYCIASMYVFFIDKYLRSHNFNRVYRLRYKFHIALLCRVMVSKNKTPKTNSKDMKKLCQKLYDNLKNPVNFKTSVKKAIEILKEVVETYDKESIGGNHLSRTTDFTSKIVGKCDAVLSDIVVERNVLELKKGNQFKCRVIGWNKSFVYLEIIDHKERASMHIRHLSNRFLSDIGDELQKDQVIEAEIIGDTPDVRYGYEMTRS